MEKINNIWIKFDKFNKILFSPNTGCDITYAFI